MSVDRLSVRIEHRIHAALNIQADFEIGAERVVLFGPSGSGKSTLLRLIAGLAQADSGRISLGDRMLFDSDARIDLPPRDRRVGLVFQDDRLFPHLDVESNVRFGIRRWDKTKADARLHELAANCGIEHILRRRPDTLSGGERQRVGLARAVAPRPGLLMCDEPVSALDLRSRFQLIETIKNIQESERIPLLFVTHGPSEAMAIGTRVLAWNAGRIEADGPPTDVLARLPLGQGFENVWRAELVSSDRHESCIRIQDGPVLTVPLVDAPTGARLTARLRADEIVLAIGSASGLSARNVLQATVDRVIRQEHEAQILTRVEGAEFVVGLTWSAVEALDPRPGAMVSLIIKARSVQCS